MYIFFASTGAVSNIVIDDEELRQGNVNVNHVYAFFANKPNILYTGTVKFERPDTLVSAERTMTPMTFTYATVSYAGYHFLIDDEWILAVWGNLKTTVRLRSGAGAVLASGLITAPIEQTVYDAEPTVTITQYNDLQAGLADKASKSQTVIHVATFADIPELDGGVYDNWMFILDDGSVYRIDYDTAKIVGVIGKNVNYVKSSVILAKGDVVQFQNATGGFVQVKKMTPAEVNVYPQLVLGFALQAFTANGFGLILTLGKLEGIDTSSGTDGAYVYADTSDGTVGGWTVTRPTAPNAIIVLGVISNATVNGTIDVRLSIIPKLAQLSDVYDPVLAQDDVLKWNASTARWEVSKELSVYKYLGSYATEALAVTAVASGSTGVLYEYLINGLPYEAVKTSAGVHIINLASNSATYYVSDTIQQVRRSIYYYNGTLIDSPANTVPEIYRNSFRSIMSANSIGSCIITKGQYGGTPTNEYAYIFIVSDDIALITVGARTWKYDYTADTFTEYYLTKTDAQSTYQALSEKGSANGYVPLGSDSKIASTYLPAYVDDIIQFNSSTIFESVDTLASTWGSVSSVEQRFLVIDTTPSAYQLSLHVYKLPSNSHPSVAGNYVLEKTIGKFSSYTEILVSMTTNKTFRISGSPWDSGGPDGVLTYTTMETNPFFTEISSSIALGETESTAYRGDRGKTAYDHSQLADGTNPHATTFANIVSKPTTMSEYGITDGVKVLTDMSTTLATAYTTYGRQVAVNGTNGSYLLVLFPDSVVGYNGRFYGSDRIGVRSFRQNSGETTIQNAFNDSVAGGGQDCYELITGTAFASLIGVSSIYNQGLYEIKDSSSSTYLYGSRYSLSATGVATLLALPANIVSQLDAKAGKFYVTNLITNGNFANTNGWSVTVGGTFSVASNKATVLGNGTNQYLTFASSFVAGTFANKKIYILAKITIPDNAPTSRQLFIQERTSAGTDTTNTNVSTNIYNSSTNLVSGLITAKSTCGQISVLTTCNYGTAEAQSGKSYSVETVLMLNLTALYGAGSEPTQVEMDKYLAQKFTNSYFDGTVEYATLADITGNKANVIKATNLLTNGSFENDLTGWTTTSGSPSISTSVKLDGSKSLVANSTGTSAQVSKVFTAIIGHKYFVSAKVITTRYVAGEIGIKFLNKVNSSVISIARVTNAWVSVCDILTADTVSASFFVGGFNLADLDGNIDCVNIIDLTATFGAGKEPTVAQMNADLAFYTNSWFDGTIPFITLGSLNATKMNRQQEDRLVPTLTNATVSTLFSYRKDGMGYVDLSGALAITSTGTNFTLPTGYRPLMTMKFCIIKDDGTNSYCQISTEGVFTSYATGTFHINIRFPTV